MTEYYQRISFYVYDTKNDTILKNSSEKLNPFGVMPMAYLQLDLLEQIENQRAIKEKKTTDIENNFYNEKFNIAFMLLYTLLYILKFTSKIIQFFNL